MSHDRTEMIEKAREAIRRHGGECACNYCEIARAYLDLAVELSPTAGGGLERGLDVARVALV